MRESIRQSRIGVLLISALAAAGCQHRDTNSARSESALADTAVATVPAAPDAASSAAADSAAAITTGAAAGGAVDAPMTIEDVDRYERGVRAEIDVARKAVDDRKRAKSSSDSLSAQFAALEQNTVEAGARAAGVSVERYRAINGVMDRVLGARQMGAAMQKQAKAMDTTGLSAEDRARVREGMAQAHAAFGDPYKDLPPDVAAVVKRRADQLDALRAQLLKLRFQAAGQ